MFLQQEEKKQKKTYTFNEKRKQYPNANHGVTRMTNNSSVYVTKRRTSKNLWLYLSAMKVQFVRELRN